MADINLVPDPQVIIGQGLAFGAAVYVVNKLILKPYLELRDRRALHTSGAKESSARMLEDIASKSLEIKETKSKIFGQINAQRAKYKEEATLQANEVIASARLAAENELKGFKKEIEQQLATERANVVTASKKICSEIFDSALIN